MTCDRHPDSTPSWCWECNPGKYDWAVEQLEEMNEQLSLDDFLGGGKPPPFPPAPPAAPGSGGDGLGRFSSYCHQAEAFITPSKVKWGDSPFLWMLHNGPRTKSKLGREIVRAWLEDTHTLYQDGDGGCHFILEDTRRVIVHLALQGKEGLLEFANLREPG